MPKADHASGSNPRRSRADRGRTAACRNHQFRRADSRLWKGLSAPQGTSANQTRNGRLVLPRRPFAVPSRRGDRAWPGVARAQERPAAARPAGGLRRRSPSRSGAAACRTRSALLRLRQERRSGQRPARPRLWPGRDRQRDAQAAGRQPASRLFRLAEDRGVINRMGFPVRGSRPPLAARHRPRRGFVGVNVGANKDSTDRAADYVACSVALAPYADYLVCNVSSPNTPGLRNLQGRTQLADLLKRVQDAIAGRPVPLLVKIAPDTNGRRSRRHRRVCRELKMDGIIVATRRCRGRRHCARRGATKPGGLSGAPLLALSTEVLRRTARRVEKQFALIGCGWRRIGAQTPMPRSAPAPCWCSSIRPWSSRARRSSAASRTSLRRSWHAMGYVGG